MVIKLFTADYFRSGDVEEKGHFTEMSALVVPGEQGGREVTQDRAARLNTKRWC